MNKTKSIGITGATGHLGTGLILKCLEEGLIVKALYHSSLPSIKHPRIQWFRGSINSLELLNKAFAEVDLLVHCAAIISLAEQSRQLLYKVNVTGTKTVIELCLKQKLKLIYISSSSAICDPVKGQSYNEEGSYRKETDFFYGHTKAISEQLVLNAVKEHSLEAFILRPTSIVGPPDYRPSLFGKVLLDISKGRLPLITSGGHHVVDLRDVCNTVYRSFEHGRNGQVYLLGGPYISIYDLAKLCRPNGIFICIPIWLLLFFTPLITGLTRTFGLKSVISKQSLRLLRDAAPQIDCSKAQKVLGHTNRPIAETITDLISWFKKSTANDP